jgi:hypothetical protein
MMENLYVNQINIACVNNKEIFIIFKVQLFGLKKR